MANLETIVSDITADIRTIVRGEIELAKAEVVPGVKKAGLGAGLLAGAGVFALIAVNVLFVCLGFVFTTLFWDRVGPIASFSLGFLCAAGVYLIIAAVLGLVGLAHVKKLRSPTAAIAEANKTADAVGNAASSGLANVRLIASRGRKMITRDETGQIVTVYSGPRHAIDRKNPGAGSAK